MNVMALSTWSRVLSKTPIALSGGRVQMVLALIPL
jgi:hypothetical protein